MMPALLCRIPPTTEDHPAVFAEFSLRPALSRLAIVVLLLSLGACTRQDAINSVSETFLPSISETDWLVVNYWATWCGPCREEIPELNALNTSEQKNGEPNLLVVGVNYDAPDKIPVEGLKAQQLLDAIDDMGIEFNTISQSQALQLGLKKPNSLPTTFLLQNNQLRHTLRGPQTAESIQSAN